MLAVADSRSVKSGGPIIIVDERPSVAKEAIAKETLNCFFARTEVSVSQGRCKRRDTFAPCGAMDKKGLHQHSIELCARHPVSPLLTEFV